MSYGLCQWSKKTVSVWTLPSKPQCNHGFKQCNSTTVQEGMLPLRHRTSQRLLQQLGATVLGCSQCSMASSSCRSRTMAHYTQQGSSYSKWQLQQQHCNCNTTVATTEVAATTAAQQA